MNNYRKLKKLRRNAEYLRVLRWFQRRIEEEEIKYPRCYTLVGVHGSELFTMESLCQRIRQVKENMKTLLECNK